jgi:dTDP-4-dehydrorhamnose 3,5-epimerase
MRFTPLSIKGVVQIDMEKFCDERGFFARSFCANEFASAGISGSFCQSSVSFNAKSATLRGMHYQASPCTESKLVRCTSGAIYDVVLDLRVDSDSYLKWTAVELTSDNHRAIFIPAGCAHGFITLKDSSEVLYMMDSFFDSASSRGVRWNDPKFNISWPLSPKVISERDASYPDY